jgi:5-methylcytosine-specific restriction endonuclease McrA
MRVHHSIWKKVFERDNGHCQYCQVDLLTSISAFWSAQVDHVIQVSVGGVDEPDNLVLACPTCNQALSRSGSLTTFEERKAYIEKWRIKNASDFEAWRADLRKEQSD